MKNPIQISGQDSTGNLSTGPDRRSLTLGVVIPTLERHECLLDVLRDLCDQTVVPAEVIVVDQSESLKEGVRERLLQVASSLPIAYYTVRFRGAGAARNFALERARSELILFLDDDTRLPADLCERHIQNYLDQPELDAVAGKASPPNEDSVDALPREFAWAEVGPMFRPMNYAHRLETCDLPTCNASVRRTVAIAVGGFDERMKRLEDSDFSIRMRKAGRRATYDPGAALVHLVVPSGAERKLLTRLNRYVPGRRERWAEYFYFSRRALSFWPRWRYLGWWIRRMVFVRGIVLRPHWFVVAVWELVAGYRLASLRLRQGPLLILSPGRLSVSGEAVRLDLGMGARGA